MVFSVAVGITTLFPRTCLWMLMAVTAKDSDLREDGLRERNFLRCGAEISMAACIDLF